MSKKNNELNEELTPLEETETEVVNETPAPETIETPEVENPENPVTIEPADVAGDEGVTEKPVEEPPVDEQLSTKKEIDAADEQPSDNEGKDKEDNIEDKDVKAKDPVDVNLFKKFNVRFSYSTDSRSTTSRKAMSVKEMVKQFIAAPTCFLALETKEDVKEFETIANSKTIIKITNKEGKLIDLPETGRKHFIERVKEHSNYFINKTGK